jgi:dienelactone hydrolase
MGKGWLALAFLGTLPLALAGSEHDTPAPREVNLVALDGTKLKATYFAAVKEGPGVLLMHQCNQQRKTWDELAGKLAAAGIHVLTVDYRGFGESGGTRFLDMPGPERAQTVREKWPGDMDSAYAYLMSQKGVTRRIAGAGGASCGVNEAIQLARRHPEVRSLVLLSGNTDLDGRNFLRKSTKVPILLSAADDDQGAVELMEWLYALSPNPSSKFVHYQTGGHGVDMFAPHRELPDMIAEWYVQTLVKTPGEAPAVETRRTTPEEVKALNLLDEPGGAAKVMDRLNEARRKDPQANLFNEGMANAIGYEHLQAGDTQDAIEIFKLNVVAYPNSPNVYDSLSDGYVADGQKDLARENAKKALALLSRDTTDDEARRKAIQESAEGKLKQLGGNP